MQDKLTLTPARFEDHATIYAIFEAMLPQYQEIMPGSFEANLENLRRIQAKGMDFSATGLTGYMIQTTQSTVGFTAVGPLNGQQAYLSAFYLLPQYQRQGLGALALQDLERHYARLHFQEMLLLVHREASWARTFYQKMGYKTLAEHTLSIVQYAGQGIAHLIEPGLILMGRSLKGKSAQ